MQKLEDWSQNRNQIRETLFHLLGDIPPKPSIPTANWVIETEEKHYTRQDFVLEHSTDYPIPATLLLPKHFKPPYPAILYLHAHGGRYELGKTEVFHPRAGSFIPADELTKQGYAILAIDSFAFEERQSYSATQKGASAEMAWFKQFLWEGKTLWGMMLRDDLIALDYLYAHPKIDKKRIGAIGMSMGSTRAWWLSALDERISTTVAIACLTRYQNLIDTDEINNHSLYYFVPNILKHFDTEYIISLIAPRPFLSLVGDQDPSSPIAGMRRIEDFTNKIYNLYHQPENFKNIIYPNTGHVFTESMWQIMVDWLNKHLSLQIPSEPQQPSKE